MEPSQFYTGLVADLYAPLKSAANNPAPYARFIARSGQPALELGCGDGEPLLDLVANGLDVDGVDSSLDMLDGCRLNATKRGLQVTLHHQSMESLNLPKRYRSIFLAGATFNLLADDQCAGTALIRIREHLAEGGSAMVPLFIPTATPTTSLGVPSEARDTVGRLIRVTTVSEERDDVARRQTTVLRYERFDDQQVSVAERPWVLHWHTQNDFRELALSAGLSTVAVLDAEGAPATESAATFAFILTVR